jgi:hypothetical protein
MVEPREKHSMGKTLANAIVLCVLLLASPLAAQNDSDYQSFSDDQLDNLLAPIALYPDPLLAQVLLAATFPDQVDEANRFVREDTDADDIDDQSWDVSVKAVAHYPEVLDMMADKLDWTTALGQAYVSQSTDVMESVQRLRAQARAAGNLETTPQMQVVVSGGEIALWPGQPEYLYVPHYNPAIVFFSHVSLFFGPRFFIGAWLNYDFDWHTHHVYYHGWEHGGGWVERSRPYVHANHFYVNSNYHNIYFNRDVIHRQVNYRMLNRYDDVHRGSNFDGFHRTNHGGYPPPPPPRQESIHNKVIMRNFNTDDPRLREFRGRPPQPHLSIPVPEIPAFTPGHGGFDPHQASHRGQVSRTQAQPPPPPRPQRQAPPPQHSQVKHEERRHS